MKILLVEDDRTTASVLTNALTSNHYVVDTATDGQMAIQMVQTFDEYDLILLDVILPGLDGISICRQLRSQGYQMPILLLTVKDSTTDKVVGLDAGADDYMVKPFEMSELIARVRALLRRGVAILPSVLTWERLQLDPSTSQVTYDGKPIRLTATEYRLLRLFLRNPQRIFSRSMILDRLWSFAEYPGEDAVTTHIRGLRQKLKAAGMTEDLIETIYGLGYRLKQVPDNVQPISNEISSQTPRQQAEAKVTSEVAKIWQRSQQDLRQQLQLLEQAASNLNPELWQRAQVEAHRLAGSLGSFGFTVASRIAREISQILERSDRLEAEQGRQLQSLVQQLQQEFDNNPVVAPVSDERSHLILIIDDDLNLVEQIRSYASQKGFRVEVATSLAAGREIISRNPPDIILLDLVFPDTDESGFTLLGELSEQKSNIPVIALTIRDSLAERMEVARLGGRAFLHKPIDLEQVIKTVSQVLNQTSLDDGKVLIVNNDPQMLADLIALLQPWGLEITPLDDPQSLWQVLTSTEPDLLILDSSMSTFSEIELCQVVRQDPRWGDLPIVVLTSQTDPDTIREIFISGADDYVGKPIVEPELITRIISRLRRLRLW